MSKTIKTIKIELTWEGTLNALLLLVESGNAEGREYALGELRRMAKIADMTAVRDSELGKKDA